MKNYVSIAILAVFFLGIFSDSAEARYGDRYCRSSGYHCIKIQRGDTWHRLWPNARERQVVAKLNRMNVQLRPGMIIAVPKNLRRMNIFDISPFPINIRAPGERLVIVDLSSLAWGAYSPGGQLQNWGPVSGGMQWCNDVKRRCRTITGSYRFYAQRGPGCFSRKYPLGRGGARMPYCMFFYRGFALHGSPVVPGYHASHGCIRAFVDDARWLNEQFVRIPGRDGVRRGTRVQVRH